MHQYITDTEVGFYSSPLDALNNWSAHAVERYGVLFPSVEHGYHYDKFIRTAPEIAALVLHAKSPAMAWKIAKEHEAQRDPDWDHKKIAVMTSWVRAKFQQNPDARAVLLWTYPKKIVENSPIDDFWGTGPEGDGKNAMGGILMLIRDELRLAEAPPTSAAKSEKSLR